MIGILRKAAIAALLLAVGNAWALGLGQIKVKSKLNEPLLAEIPIVSTAPGELAALRARMASPETFRRIGLTPPTGAAADLQFSLGSDARGRPVIRVTSVRPVDQAMVNFLIEVDWGEGKLVREYSALIESPNTASAPVQAGIQTPATPAPNLVRRPELPAAPAPAETITSEPLAPAPESAPTSMPAAPVPEIAEVDTAVAVAPPPTSAPLSPAPVADATPAPSAVAPTEAGQYGPVRRGETLSTIAHGLDLRNSFSLDQTMLALLHANPDAFINDNINRLRQGSVLRVPESGQAAQIDAAEASAVVRQQMQDWRQAQRPVLQPQTAAASGGTRALRPEGVSMALRPGAAVMPSAGTAASAGSRRSEARLEIAPATGTGRATGTETGTGNGRGGSMLQQEVRQRDEEIASKSAEVGELKERVAELERLRSEQQQLLNMKDTELAAAQHRLAEANRAATQPAATPAAAAEVAQPAHTGKGLYYLGGGLGVLLIGLLVWFASKRRKDEAPARRRAFDHDALAASMRQVDRKRADSGTPAAVPAAPTDKPDASKEVPAPSAGNGRGDVPAWHSGWVVKESVTRSDAQVQETQPQPTTEADGSQTAAPASPSASADSASEPPARASAEQRFKLVDAFLDMGDKTSAQQLLAELLNDEDDAVSEKAGKMLARIMG